jgi:dihydroxyacetone kinase-like predicted kinase
MIEEIGRIASGEITHAVRDTTIDDKEIREGDYMGIGDKGILSVCENIEDTFIGLLGELVTDESSLVSIYYGSDVSSDEAAAMSQKVTEEFPDLEVELQDGGQPVYYYVISVE